jgi:hypothetical protein
MHNKQNKQSRTYVQGLRSFGTTLPRGLKGILKKNGFNYSEIISKWNILVGKDISDFAYPKSVKMKNGESNGTLILAIKRGNEINIEYSKNRIIDKINSYFGYKLINEIRLVAHNSESKKIENSKITKKLSLKFKSQISEIRNDSIKNSLSQLLKVVNK